MTKDLGKYKQPFDPDWPHGHLWGGTHPARLICRDLNSNEPLVWAVDTGDGEIVLYSYSDGNIGYGRPVINAPAPKRTWWANVYMTRSGVPSFYTFHTKEDADAIAEEERIACVQITEGEGLEDD